MLVELFNFSPTLSCLTLLWPFLHHHPTCLFLLLTVVFICAVCKWNILLSLPKITPCCEVLFRQPVTKMSVLWGCMWWQNTTGGSKWRFSLHLPTLPKTQAWWYSCPSQPEYHLYDTSHGTHHSVVQTRGLWLVARPNAQNRKLTAGRSPIQGTTLSLPPCRRWHKGWIISGFGTQWQGHPPTQSLWVAPIWTHLSRQDVTGSYGLSWCYLYSLTCCLPRGHEDDLSIYHPLLLLWDASKT